MSYYKGAMGPPRMRRCRFFCKRGWGLKSLGKSSYGARKCFGGRKNSPISDSRQILYAQGETDARIDDTAHHNALRSHICHICHICRNAPRYL